MSIEIKSSVYEIKSKGKWSKVRATSMMALNKWAKENNIETIKPKEKHRYFFINADKKTKAEMIKKIRYPIINKYPKCDKQMYDAGELIDMKIKDDVFQHSLF